MTSEQMRRTALHRVALAAACAFALSMWSSAAGAQTVAFAPLEFDEAGYGAFLGGELAARTGWTVYDANFTGSRLDAVGCPPATSGRVGRCLTTLAASDGVDVVVEGVVLGDEMPQSITLWIYEASTATARAEVSIPLTGGLIASDDAPPAFDRIAAGVRQAAGPVETTAPRSVDGHDRARLLLEVSSVRRNLSIDRPENDLDFEAPYYPGVALVVQLFPVALFAREHALAPLGVSLRFGKHAVTTVTDLEIDGELVEFDVPTRHDVTDYALFYEATLTDRLRLTPTIGWRVIEYALGNNPIYQSSFYRSVDIDLQLDVLATRQLAVGLGFAVRPAVDLGSTAQVYGDEASAFGFGVDVGATWVFDMGLRIGVAARLDRYATTYRSDAAPADTEATDTFQSFLLSFGYGY